MTCRPHTVTQPFAIAGEKGAKRAFVKRCCCQRLIWLTFKILAFALLLDRFSWPGPFCHQDQRLAFTSKAFAMAAPTPAQHYQLEIEDKHADEDERHVFNTYQQLLNNETSPYQAAQTVDQITFGPESRIAEFYRKDFPWPLLLKAVEQTPIYSQKVFIQFATTLDTLGPWNGSVATRIGDAVYETWHSKHSAFVSAR